MNVITLNADNRAVDGSVSANSLRKEGKVPGVLYGTDQNVHFSLAKMDLRKIIYTPNFNLVDLVVDGATYRCILKDYQMHPVTDELEHVDLLALQNGRTFKVEIPVRFTGTSVGVKAGGTIVQKVRKVKIKTTPEKLVDVFEVDITDLDLGQSVRIRDMVVGEGIEVMNPPAIPMATIEIPRALKSAQAAAAAEESAAEA